MSYSRSAQVPFEVWIQHALPIGEDSSQGQGLVASARWLLDRSDCPPDVQKWTPDEMEEALDEMVQEQAVLRVDTIESQQFYGWRAAC